MKIAVDLTSLSYHMSGIERYAACITLKMLEYDYVNEYILIFRNKVYEPFVPFIDNERIKSKILEGNNKVVFLQVTLLFFLYKLKADRYLFFAFPNPILFRRKGIYNTIHDMGAWDCKESMSLLQRIYWKIAYKIAAISSEYIITVSEFSKGRISQILNFPKSRIAVIPSGIYEGVIDTNMDDCVDVTDEYKIPDKYILTLSTLEPKKNVEILLEVFSEIKDKVDYDLVLVGRNGWKMNEIINKYDKDKRIHITGFVKDEHLSLIYKNALCFVFPSLYEGFGLPPLEALALGSPVIASNAASIPEILMERAIYFEKNSKDELKKLLLSLEDCIDEMPKGLNEYQKKNYIFSESAKKVIQLIVK